MKPSSKCCVFNEKRERNQRFALQYFTEASEGKLGRKIRKENTRILLEDFLYARISDRRLEAMRGSERFAIACMIY